MHSIRSLVAGVALVATIAACSGGGAAASATAPADAAATVVAQNHKFTEPAVKLPAGAATKVFFKNLDGDQHNVAIYTDSSAGTSLFVGGTITNAAAVYDVPALQPGHYFFRCDIHPDMTGTVDVGA